MNAPRLPAEIAAAAFARMQRTAAQHLRLALFGTIARVVESCAEGDVGLALGAHPFLGDYVDEMQSQVPSPGPIAAAWRRAVRAWEADAAAAGAPLPLVALRDAGVCELGLELLLAAGLVEEDPRFGDVFEREQRGERRPTYGLLMAWWRDSDDSDDNDIDIDSDNIKNINGSGGDSDRCDAVRNALQSLIDHGLVQVANADAPRADWALSVALPVWDVLRGEPPALRWLRGVKATELPTLADYVAGDTLAVACATLPALLQQRPAPLLLLRGAAHNGRKTLAGALARALGRPLLLLREAAALDDETRWRLFGALAAMTRAVPVVELELAPGESRTLPALPLCDAPLVVVTGRHGAWAGADGRPALCLELPLPGAAERARHWQAALHTAPPAGALQLRLSSGSIRHVAAAARGNAALAGREAIDAADIERGCRTLQSARLETLSTRIEVRGTLADLAVDETTRDELDMLVARCRWREQLAGNEAGGAGVGVRALFGGPSGSGKTLAARLLAAELGKALYRIDLAATVSKYLGETEKSLNRALGAAEELDVVLLLDEGDALMAGRTDVGSSNDRYANLETNFLLQRIESFEGILVVTTNAVDRIDRAFARRMDAVVNFRSPDAWRRLAILRLHLDRDHLDERWLEDAATRCALSGGQLRNVVTHARLLALQAAAPVSEHHLHAALQAAAPISEHHLHAALVREYRKTGASCPLRPWLG